VGSLTNLTLSVNHQPQSDEIDIVAIGPSGGSSHRDKAWTAHGLMLHTGLGHEAERVTNKARKIGTTLRQVVSPATSRRWRDLVEPRGRKMRRFTDKRQCGALRIYAFNDWKALPWQDSPTVFGIP